MTTPITQGQTADQFKLDQLLNTIDSAETTPNTADFMSRLRSETGCDPTSCQYKVDVRVTLQPVNGQSVSMGSQQVRCRLQTPEHRGEEGTPTAHRPLSPRSAWALGLCTPQSCPLEKGDIFVQPLN